MPRFLPQLDALWHVGVVNAPIARFLDPAFVPDIEWLPSAPLHEYYADPFPLETAAGPALICEAYDYTARRGRLVELRQQGATLQRRVLHAPAHHVSFPCVVQSEGRVLCIPEQGATASTRLYELDVERGRFVAEHVLLPDFGAADPVLFHHAGLWWLFSTSHRALPAQELHVFHAEHLLGPYRAHRKNPQHADASRARSAGLPFEVDGRLYRAAQDDTARYGGGLALLEILQCTPDAFEERVVRRLAPSDPVYGLGFHTLNAAGARTLVDGLRSSVLPPVARALAGGVDRLRRALTG